MIKILIKTIFISLTLCGHIFADDLSGPEKDLIELKALLLTKKYGDFYSLKQSIEKKENKWSAVAKDLKAEESNLKEKLSETPFIIWLHQNLLDYSKGNEIITNNISQLSKNMVLWQEKYAGVRDSLLRNQVPDEAVANLIKNLLDEIDSFVNNIGETKVSNKLIKRDL